MKKRLICIALILCFTSALFAQVSDVVIDETILEPKDPIVATVVAFGPGLLAHGFGHFYAEDYRMGLMLFGTEVLSIVLIAAGYFQSNSPEDYTELGGNNDEVRRGGLITMVSGIALFAAGWLADIAMAGRAAEQYNIEHNLKFKLNQEAGDIYTPSLMLTYNY